MPTDRRLIVTSGLPGSGKSTIAEGLAGALSAPIFSVDPIEAAMWVSGLPKAETGIAAYNVAQALASENLKLGRTVIVDAVNPVDAARQMWRDLAEQQSVDLVFIEIVCSDVKIHRERIEARARNIDGMPEVTWEAVQSRRDEYERWTEDRLVLDSAFEPPSTLIAEAIEYVISRDRNSE